MTQRVHQFLRLLLKVGTGGIVSLIVISALALWRLNQAPFSLNYFAQPWIAKHYPSKTFTVKEVDLVWQGWKNPFVIQLQQVVIQKSHVRLTIPLVELTFKFSGLYKKKFLPTFIHCLNPLCTFKKEEKGEKDPSELLNFFSLEGSLRKLRQFQITGGQINREDIRVEKVDLFGICEEKKVKGILRFTTLKDTYCLPLKIDFSYHSLEKKLSLDALWNEQDLQPWLCCFTDIEIKAPFKGKITAQWNFNHSVFPENIQGEIEGLKGVVKTPFLEKPFPLNSFRIILALQKNRLLCKEIKIKVEESSLTGEGFIDLPLTFLSRIMEESISLKERAFSFKIEGKDIPWLLLTAGWPLQKLEKARSWIAEHISKGIIPKVSVQGGGKILAQSPGEILLETFQGEGDFQHTSLWYKENLPLLEQMKGKVFFDKEKVDIRVDSCECQSLKISEGRFIIDVLKEPFSSADLQLKFQGDLAQVLGLLSSPSLNFLKSLPLKREKTKGKMQGSFKVSFPLKADLVATDFSPFLESSVKEATTEIVLLERNLFLENHDLSVHYEPSLLVIKGKGNVYSGEALYDIRYKRDQTVDAAIQSKMLVSSLEDFLPIFKGYSEGTIGVDLHYHQDLKGKNPLTTLKGKADFQQAQLNISTLNWYKKRDIPFILGFSVTPHPTEISFAVQAEGKEATVKGEGKLNPTTSELTFLHFPLIHLGANNFSCDLLANHLTIKGKELDISRVFQKNEDNFSDSVKSFKADIRLNKLVIRPGQSLGNAHIDLEVQNHFFIKFLLKGHLQEKKKSSPVDIRLELSSPRQRTLKVNAANGGALFQLLGITRTIKGGKLEINAQQRWVKGALSQPERLRGTLLLKEFEVINAGFFTRLFSLTMIVGIFDLVRGQGISFGEAKIKFNVLEDVITIEKCLASGLSLGITAEGTIDRKKDQMALHGTLIPVYLINSTLSKIPLVGQLLSGGRKGIFSTSYKVKGSLKNPEIHSNPLSTLTPGFIQQFFSSATEEKKDEKMTHENE